MIPGVPKKSEWVSDWQTRREALLLKKEKKEGTGKPIHLELTIISDIMKEGGKFVKKKLSETVEGHFI